PEISPRLSKEELEKRSPDISCASAKGGRASRKKIKAARRSGAMCVLNWNWFRIISDTSSGAGKSALCRERDAEKRDILSVKNSWANPSTLQRWPLICGCPGSIIPDNRSSVSCWELGTREQAVRHLPAKRLH